MKIPAPIQKSDEIYVEETTNIPEPSASVEAKPTKIIFSGNSLVIDPTVVEENTKKRKFSVRKAIQKDIKKPVSNSVHVIKPTISLPIPDDNKVKTKESIVSNIFAFDDVVINKVFLLDILYCDFVNISHKK